MRPNHTAAAVLGHLMDEPMTGWQLAQRVQMALCDFFNVTRSQVYRELRTLTDAGLVEPGETGVRDQRPYTITDTGREMFLSWLHEDPGAEVMRSPFFLKLSFSEHLDDATVERFVERHRQWTQERLAYYRDLEPTVEAFSAGSAHVLRAGIAYREAMLRWLDTLPRAVGRSGHQRHHTGDE